MRILLLTMASVFISCFVHVQDTQARTEGIAVVVNEDAITISDVNDRMKLILASSGLPNTQDIYAKLMPQIVGSLVDEQIRLQEAAKLDIGVSQAEVEEGFSQIAQQNNFTAEQFRGMLKQGGINISTMEHQIRAQIAWGKVVQQKLRPQVVVSDSDIDNYLDRMKRNSGMPEYLVSEIFLPVDDPGQQNETAQLARKLVQEIRGGKAPFFKVAQQFSKSAGAPQGGSLGWISKGQLQQELDDVLPSIGNGQVSDPIRSISGYHILQVNDQRIISEETLPARDEVMRIIGLQRLDRLQRRYLLDLKSAAYIDNRMES